MSKRLRELLNPVEARKDVFLINLKGVNNEVVLLEATTEEALRKTHRRYFENLAELMLAPAQ